MIATLVFVDVKPEYVDAFRKISCYNHDNSRLEPGNVRFDVLEDKNDPTQFVLYVHRFACQHIQLRRV